MREAGAIARIRIGTWAGDELYGAGAGHDEEIEKIAAAGAAQMRVAEAHDGSIRDVVTGAPVPIGVGGVRAELHGAEGHACTGKTVAMTACSDASIDPAKRIGGIGALRNCER